MTKEEYINYPAVSASRIKRFYTGDISKNKATKAALDKGAAFHHQLLETDPSEMSKEAYNVYNAICSHPMLEALFNGSEKEMIVVDEVVIPYLDGSTAHIMGKGMLDMVNHQSKVIVDIKTTTCKTIEQFAKDMIEHCNHVQAVWYSMLMGWSPRDFYYIGVPQKAKKQGSTSSDLFLYRHSDDELDYAVQMIGNFLEQFDGNFNR